MGVTTDRTKSVGGETPPNPRPALRRAEEVMTPNPRSIRGDATVEEAIAFLVDTGYSAAPVLDEAGRAIGVISRTDVVVYDRARVLQPRSKSWYFEPPQSGPKEPSGATSPLIRVADLMNPQVFTVTRDTPLGEVADRMVALNVHRLFVVDDDGSLVGVISALDLLASLRG